MTILGADFKGLFAAALGPLLHDVTLLHLTPGTVDPADPSAGNRPTSTTVTGKGTSTKIVASYVDKTTGARKTDFTAIVLLGTMSQPITPTTGDTITVPDPRNAGSTSLVGRVIQADVDPDGASATLKCLA